MKHFLLVNTSFLLFLICIDTSAQMTSWDQIGPFGGDVRVFSHDEHNNLYAGTAGGGIYSTSNNGSTWNFIGYGIYSSTVRSILPMASGDIYAGTEYGLFKRTEGFSGFYRIDAFGTSAVRSLLYKSPHIFAGTDAGVYKSTDDGATWNFSGLSSSAIRVLGAASNGDILAGTSGQGLYRSRDNGSTWVTSGLSTLMVRSVAFGSGSNVYAGVYGGIYKSANNGESWTDIGLDGIDVPQVAVKSNGQLFAATWEGVFTSTNNGTTWVPLGFSESITWSLFIDNLGYVYIGRDGEGIWRSTNNGAAWAESNNGLAAARIQTIALDNSGNIFTGISGGAFKSTNDGLTWTRILTSASAGRVWSFLFNNDNDYLMGTSKGLYRSSDRGDTWTILALPEYSVKAIKKNSLGYLFAGTTDGFYRSTDNGMNWTLNVGGLQSTIVNDVEVTSNNTIFASVSGYSGLYKSTNHGYTWYASASGLSSSYAYDIYDDKSGNMYVITSASTHRSTNGGSYWMDLGTPGSCFYVDSMRHKFLGTNQNGIMYQDQDTIPTSWLTDIGPANKNISCLTGNSAGYVYAGTFGGSIYKSMASFTPVELVSFTSVVKDNSVSLSWKTATELNNKGFFIERKDDDSWESITFIPGKGTTSDAFEYFYIDKNLHPAKYLYRLKQVDFNGEVNYSNIIEAEVFPSDFTLLQNYPNPFNPSTTIKFSVPNQQSVQLKVYGILGTECSELFNEIAAPGKVYSITFTPKDASSGVYFYNLITANQILTRKMILLK